MGSGCAKSSTRPIEWSSPTQVRFRQRAGHYTSPSFCRQEHMLRVASFTQMGDAYFQTDAKGERCAGRVFIAVESDARVEAKLSRPGVCDDFKLNCPAGAIVPLGRGMPGRAFCTTHRREFVQHPTLGEHHELQSLPGNRIFRLHRNPTDYNAKKFQWSLRIGRQLLRGRSVLQGNLVVFSIRKP